MWSTGALAEPEIAKAARQLADGWSAVDAQHRYQVSPGENLGTIARKLFLSWEAWPVLWAANSALVPAPLRPVVGDSIQVPPVRWTLDFLEVHARVSRAQALPKLA